MRDAGVRGADYGDGRGGRSGGGVYTVLKNALPQGVAVVGSPKLLEGRSYEGAERIDAEEVAVVRRCGGLERFPRWG